MSPAVVAGTRILLPGLGAEEEVGLVTALNCFIFEKGSGTIPLPDLVSGGEEAVALIAGRFEEAFRTTCAFRCVFMSLTGLAGVGPSIMTEGDVVAVFHGLQLPFVLRPSGEDNFLLGWCYVYGIMQGEALQKHEEDGKPDTVFGIR